MLFGTLNIDLLKTDDQLTIVNRSKVHKFSKKRICLVPYFEEMLKESKDNKIELDFDEKALKSFLNWLASGNVSIEIDYVINLYNMVDNFGIRGYLLVGIFDYLIKDLLLQDCINYFKDNFTIEHLPVVIPQVTPVSKVMNSSHLNAFICRYFTKIVNTTVWLDYPIETIEYICALNLMIHSEYQVFDAIMKWANFKTEARKCYLERLFKLVRWCHLEDKDSSRIKEQFQSLNCQPSKLCSSKNCDLTGNRTKQEYFIEIYKLNGTSLRIIISDINFYPLIEQVVKLNDSMTIDIFHDEHVSDIFFDCGKEGIRIDWKLNEYRLLDKSQFKTYYIKIHHVIKEKKSFKDNIELDEFCAGGVALLEASENFMLYFDDWSPVCWPANAELISKYYRTDRSNEFRLTILDDYIYILIKSDFIKLNIYSHAKIVIGLERFESMVCNRLHFENLLIASRKANDDRVILIDKSTKDAFCFNANTQQCGSMGRIIDCEIKSENEQKESNAFKTFDFKSAPTDSIKLPAVICSTNKLLTLASTFISMDTMRTCLTHNDKSKNQRRILPNKLPSECKKSLKPFNMLQRRL